MTGPEIADRRQRAREAALDEGVDGVPAPTVNVEAAIETATRVRVDADITQAARDAVPTLLVMVKRNEFRKMIEAAFEAAGFEVEQ